jgi:hypothetical protein
MKKIYAFITAIILLTTNIEAQTPVYQWAKSFGSTGRDWAYAVTSDTSGNTFVTGLYTGTVDFDPGAGVDNHASNGGTDIFLAKYDPSGNFLWARTFGSSSSSIDEQGNGIVTDSAGNVYFTGQFAMTVDFDPGPGVVNLNSTNPFTGAFIAKFDPSGNYIWAFQIGGNVTSTSGSGTGINIDAYSNIYATGIADGNIDFDAGAGVANVNCNGAYFAKYTSTGAYVYGKAIPGGGAKFNSIVVDQSKNVVLTGQLTTSPSDFDPGPGVVTLSGVGVSDVCMAKYDTAGNYLWAKRLDGSGFDYSTGITVDQSGNIAITGYYENTIDLDPGAGSSTYSASPSGVSDAFVAKYDTSGNFIWGFPIASTGSELCQGITSDLSGNIYVTGGFAATVDFDPGPSVANLTFLGGRDIYVAGYSPAGNYISAFKIGSSGYDLGFGICIGSSGFIYVTGLITNTADFDPGIGTANVTPTADGGNGDVFIAKYAPCTLAPVAPGTISGATTVCTGSVNTYSVTPISGASSYTWTFPSGWSGTSITNSISATAGSISGNITVTANNACGNSTAQTLAVVVNTIPTTPVTISGTAAICSGSSNTYSVTNDPSATSYTWTLPGGWTGTSTTNSINTTASATSGNITVTADNSCGSSSPQTLAITVNIIPVTPGTISGTTTVCSGSSNTYSVTNDPSATSYTWTLPGGWSGTSTTNTINTTASSTSENITVTADNACGNSSPQTLAITVNPLPNVTANATDNNICTGDPTTLTGGNAVSYVWTGGVTDGVAFNPGATLTYTVTGTDVNTCSNTATITVTVNNLPAVNFNYTGNDTVCVGDGIQSLNGGTPSGGTYSGAGVTGTNFDPNTAGIGAHNITYSFTDVNSCTNTDLISITVIGCAGIEDNDYSTITVYPNPFTNSISLMGIKKVTGIKMYNVLGEVFGNWIMTENNNTISTENLRSGVYFLFIQTTKGTITQKIIKN